MKPLLLLLSLLAMSLTGVARDAAEAFAQAPASVFPLLDRNTRLDMIDYYRSGLATPSLNGLDGHSAITELTPASLSVKLTDSSSAQVALLKAGGDSIIAVISTVATPGLDSTISFYTIEWKPLPASRYFAKPGWKEWLNPGGDLSTVTAMAPFMLASYFYDPAAMTLTLTNNLGKFLDEDAYSIVSPELQGTLVYAWTGGKFARK